MADFNPELERPRSGVPSWEGSSKGRSSVNVKGIFDGLSNAIEGVIKNKDTDIRADIRKTAQAVAEGNALIPSEELDTTKIAGPPLESGFRRSGEDPLPAPLRSDIDRFTKIARASRKRTGRVSRSAFETTAWALMKRAESMYPGYEDVVRQEIMRSMGYNPVESTRRSFIRDAEERAKLIGESAERRNRQIDILVNKNPALWATAIDNVLATRGGFTREEALDPANRYRIYPMVADELARLQQKDDNDKREDAARERLIKSTKIDDEKRLGAFNSRAINTVSKEIRTTISTLLRENNAANIPELMKMVSDGTTTESFEEFHGSLKNLRSTMARRIRADYYQNVPRSKQSAEDLEKVVAASLKPFDDIYSALTSKDYGALEVAMLNQTLKDNRLLNQLTEVNPLIGEFRSLQNVFGKESPIVIQWMKAHGGSKMFDNMDHTVARQAFLNSISNPKQNFFRAINILNGRPDGLATENYQKYVLMMGETSTNILKDPSAPKSLKEQVIRYMFGATGEKGRERMGFDFIPEGERKAFLKMYTSDTILKEINKVSPAYQQIYRNFFEDAFSDQTLYGKEFFELYDKIENHKSLTFLWDGENFHIKQDLTKSEKGMNLPGDRRRVTATVENSSAALQGLKDFMVKLKKVYPEKSPEQIFTLMKESINKTRPEVANILSFAKPSDLKEETSTDDTKKTKVKTKVIEVPTDASEFKDPSEDDGSTTTEIMEKAIKDAEKESSFEGETSTPKINIVKTKKIVPPSEGTKTKTRSLRQEPERRPLKTPEESRREDLFEKTFGKKISLRNSPKDIREFDRFRNFAARNKEGSLKTDYQKVTNFVETYRGRSLLSQSGNHYGRFHMGQAAIAEGMKNLGVSHRSAVNLASELKDEFAKGNMKDLELAAFQGWTRHNENRLRKEFKRLKKKPVINDVNRYIVHVLDEEGVKLATADNSDLVQDAVSSRGLSWMKGNRRLFTLNPEKYTVGEIKKRVKRVLTEERIAVKEKENKGKAKKKEPEREKAKVPDDGRKKLTEEESP